MLDRTQLMGLTAHEMTVLVGGMRVLVPIMAVRSTASSPIAKAY
jgi:catalase (peroxidase I)